MPLQDAAMLVPCPSAVSIDPMSGRPRLAMFKAAGNIGSRNISVRQGMRVVGTGERDFVEGRMAKFYEEICLLEQPIVKAANVRPDTNKPLPYFYGFIRAVAPLYLRLPSKEEQLATEFQLSKHLAWWERKGHEENENFPPGANDAAKELFPQATPAPHGGDGIMLGGKTDKDPPPFWLATGARKIPNVSGFEVPSASIFANRVRRHTGIAFIDGFQAGPEFDNRRFPFKYPHDNLVLVVAQRDLSPLSRSNCQPRLPIFSRYRFKS